MALNCFLIAMALGLPPASYCTFHSASAQLNTTRAVPAARAKYWTCSGVGRSLILCALIIRDHLFGSGESQGSCQVFVSIVATIGQGTVSDQPPFAVPSLESFDSHPNFLRKLRDSIHRWAVQLTFAYNINS